ncbi:hypothetical protein CDV55_101796 [Aspergillus turcosus]|nr:hypothetical protein CDV55_101796 [Aspergillus turcosus]
MVFPLPPSSDIDWDNMDPTRPHLGRGHVEATFHAATGTWTKPRWVESPYLSIHGLAPCLQYGQQVFEGLKGKSPKRTKGAVNPRANSSVLASPQTAFRGPNDEVYIFRPRDHARRMARSSAAVCMPALEEEFFLECVRKAVAGNTEILPPHGSNASLYIRPFLLGSGPQFAPIPPNEFTFAVFVAPLYAYLGTQALDALILDEFDRAAPKGTGAVKVGGNYAPVMPWSIRARQQGYGMTLHLDSLTHTEIDEFSTSAFVGIIDENGERTVVVTDSQNIIESFTSDSCVALARSLGWKVEKRPILYTELGKFTEVIAAGSAAALVPIRSITRPSTGDKFVFGSTNPCCAELSKMLSDYQRGMTEDVFGWRYRVEADGIAPCD